MNSIKKQVYQELEIKKSIFHNYAIPVNSVEDVQEKLAQLKEQYPTANHHCYAYIIGNNQEVQKYSDDGEPSKTAGYPMMEVLKKHDLTNILVVSVRYFGGIKLGAGGLVRAYTKGVAACMLEIERSDLAIFYDIEIIIPFDYTGVVEKLVRDTFPTVQTTYDTKIHYFVEMLSSDYEDFSSHIINITKGNGQIQILLQKERYI